MAASAPIVALAGALGTSTAVAGTAMLGAVGSVIGGIGRGLMAKKEREEDRRDDEIKRQRLEASYTGAGEAMRFWEDDDAGTTGGTGVDPDYQRVSATDNQGARVGERVQKKRPGEQYRMQPSGVTQKRFQYDPATGQIKMA